MEVRVLENENLMFRGVSAVIPTKVSVSWGSQPLLLAGAHVVHVASGTVVSPCVPCVAAATP